MAEMKLTIVGLEPFLARLASGDAVIERELRTAMHEATLMVERDAKASVPRDTGTLYRSIISEVDRGPVLRGRVGVLHGPATQYARVVEEGRRAGSRPPPSAAIARWLGRKGGDPAMAFVVARSIGRRGIKARPFLGPAVAKNRAPIQALFERARDRLVKHLAGKG